MILPIRITVTTAFALFTAATIFLVATLDYIGSRETILASAKQSMANSIAAAELGVDRLLDRAILSADTIADLPLSIFDWRAPDTMLIALSVALRNSPDIYGVFVGFPDGAFVQAVNLTAPDGSHRDVPGMPKTAATAWRVIGAVDGAKARTQAWRYLDATGAEMSGSGAAAISETTYDPRVRAWFTGAQKYDETTLSKVYVFSSLKRPGITVSKPIRNFAGATVGVDLPLDDLARLMAQLSPGKNGVVAIVDGDGDMVAHPDPEKIVQQTAASDAITLVPVSASDDIRLRTAAALASAQTQTDISFALGGEEFIAFSVPVNAGNTAGWRIVSIAAEADFTGALDAILWRTLEIAIAVLIVAVCGVSLISGWIARPIIHLRDMADQITRMNFSAIGNFRTPFDEVIQLQQSMERMRRAIDLFMRYVPHDVVRSAIESGGVPAVGGIKRRITLLFTDIEGFTSMSECMSPEEIVSQTSEYFERLSFGIQANRGVIDKYIGDAIMAIWNAPSDDENHVDNACRGALAAYGISEDLNAELADKGMPIMRTRFGLHTDEVFVGNIGAGDRMQYTCLGSGVNLASRIEGLNKHYGTQVLASDAVRRRASSDFLFRRVDIVEAKGTTIPVTIYELMGERGDDTPLAVDEATVRRASIYEQAFDHYLHRDFDDAVTVLDGLISEAPDDPVVNLLMSKCRCFAAEPPPADWNGATALDEK